MREEIVNKAKEFLEKNVSKLASFEGHCKREAEYRIEHSYRVANIMREIALKEGFDEERAYVTALLHDVGYSVEFKTREEYRNHGRVGAAIARPFLLELGYSAKDVNEMCYGIAIHVDDKADFDGERTPFAISVGDADNIDRFDAFRIYDQLSDVDYKNMPIEDQRAYVEKVLNKLPILREAETGTETGRKMWQEKVDYQIGFYKKLLNQIENSK